MSRTHHLQNISRNRYWLSQFACASIKLPVSGSEGSGVLSGGIKQPENEAHFIYEVMYECLGFYLHSSMQQRLRPPLVCRPVVEKCRLSPFRMFYLDHDRAHFVKNLASLLKRYP